MVLNKRGQGLSVNAIILIVLGVVVLAVLIFGFTVGFGKISPFVSGNNVDTIVKSCTSACVVASTYDYCTSPRELKAGGVDLKEVTCNYLSREQKSYGVETCPGIPCDNFVVKSGTVESAASLTCIDNSGSAISGGKTVQQLSTDNTLLSNQCS